VRVEHDRIMRHPERSRDDRADLNAVLDAGHHVGSLSTVVDGVPWVVPMLYARVGDRILLHGSTGAGALRYVAAGARAALCVTHVDGWVYAHSLFESSANYRSAVVHGTLVRLTGPEAAEALTGISDVIFPGRSSEVPAHTRKQLAATQALAMDIAEGQWTVKIRNGPPSTPEDGDEVIPGLWAGTVPIRSSYGPPEPAAWLPPDVPLSPSIEQLYPQGANGQAG
jgi:nitroimidazol reductase NimA-like FMN-containing flavoprotein (pyridoxamine 5'-phosphate oxidase superfamily)